MLALRYLRARRREAFISVIAGFSFLGIMLGVATLIVVMAVMNGFRAELLDKILGINGHLVLQAIDRPLDDFDAVSDRVSAVDGVELAIPFVEGQALASGLNASNGVIVRGISEDSLKALPSLPESVRSGTLDGFDAPAGEPAETLVIGSRLASTLGVTVGDSITIVTPRGSVTPFGVTPRIKAYRVQAIFEIGMSEYDLVFVYMPLAEAQAYFNRGETVSGIDVYVDDPDAIGAMRATIEGAAQRSLFSVDWRQRNLTFFSALEVERNVMFLILTMIVLVAALNVVSGMIMLVKDKGRDIAILRTMGATRGAILRVFIMTGASIGMVGTACGFVLGTIICANAENIRRAISALTQTELFSPELYYLSRLPADMDPVETTMILVIALGLSLLATLYPAWRAAKLDPVEALRYE
ncbi:MAG: lipoprotein-releasing ABC transporter permease subunit [Devosiaceae bacterium]|nr:lipoprotein-releasing ABC transporter permease subunit [Devosiaceae bacterium MH13]